MQLLSPGDIDRLMLPEEIEITLKERLSRQVTTAVNGFFTGEEVGSVANLNTLKTDARVIIMRLDTLYALFQAFQTNNVQPNNVQPFRLAGYKAGSLYGLGVIQWFVTQSRRVFKEDRLPDTVELLKTCLQIDRASLWGNLIIDPSTIRQRNDVQWEGNVVISQDFLSCEESKRVFEKKESHYKVRHAFWEAYLEGTFSTTLLAWRGMRLQARHNDVPLLIAECTGEIPDSLEDLNFKLKVLYPLENETQEKTFSNLNDQLLIPYLSNDFPRVLSSARVVIEEFIRELLHSKGLPQGGVRKVFQWLHDHLPSEALPKAEDAVALLEQVYDISHKYHHTTIQESEISSKAKEILQLAVPSVFLSCKHIKLSRDQREELQDALKKKPDDSKIKDKT